MGILINNTAAGNLTIVAPAAGSNTIGDTGGGGVTDHGALTGLADDDHQQYTLTSGTTRADIELPASPTNGYVLAWDTVSGKLKLIATAASAEISFSLGNVTGATNLTITNGAVQYGTATGAVVWTFAGAPASGTIGSVTLELTNGGAFTQTWPASVKWDGGAAPLLTAAGLDILEFYTRDGGTTWRGFLAAKDSK